MRPRALFGLVLSLLGVQSIACSEEVLIGMDRIDSGESSGASAGTAASVGGAGGSSTGATSGSGGTPSAGGSAGATGAGTAGTAGTAGCVQARCGSAIYPCGDCDDNDGDGLIDANDPECLGPCDATEESLMLGIPGSDTGSCRADCVFDRGAGRGDDGCLYTHECDPLSIAPDYPPTGRSKCAHDENATIPSEVGSCAEFRATQPQQCTDLCLPLAPNGCDCFGCCEIPGRSGTFVWVGAAGADVGACTPDTLGDPSLCPRCTPVGSCFNPCDECEYCTGGVMPAESCGGVAAECDLGRAPCNPALPCPSGNYCITGCCVPEPR